MNLRHVLQRFAGYVLTGGLAAVVDLGGFVLLVKAGLPIAAAATLSFLAAAGVNYALTSVFVFRSTLEVRRGLIFLALASVGMVVNVGITAVTVSLLDFPAALAKFSGIGGAFLLNFALNYLFVFRGR